eukprot:1158885-Pelagomonas_calceolata.AAC.2
MDDVTQATATQRALHGLKWPPGTNKLLAVSPLAEEVAKLSITELKLSMEVMNTRVLFRNGIALALLVPPRADASGSLVPQGDSADLPYI